MSQSVRSLARRLMAEGNYRPEAAHDDFDPVAVYLGPHGYNADPAVVWGGDFDPQSVVAALKRRQERMAEESVIDPVWATPNFDAASAMAALDRRRQRQLDEYRELGL